MRPGWKPEFEPELAARFLIPFEVAGPEDAPLLVAMGGISASRHVSANAEDRSEGWWRKIVGPGLAIDSREWRVLGIDFIGAPDTIEPLGRDGSRAQFHITPGDQADAVVAVLDHLGEQKVHRAVGASYGGNAALALGIRYPRRAEGVVVIAAAHRPHPLGTGVRSVQRAILEFARDQGREADGVAIARALAFTTYKTDAPGRRTGRCRSGWSRRCTGGPAPVRAFGYSIQTAGTTPFSFTHPNTRPPCGRASSFPSHRRHRP